MLLLLGVLAAVPPDPEARLEAAVSRFETAKFAQARDLLIDVLNEPLGDASKARALGYLAATYLALRDKPSALYQLRTLAREQPGAKASLKIFAPELIALADEVWAEADKRRAQQVKLTPPPAPPQPAGEVENPPLPGPPSRALAFVPLGVGHFARGAVLQGVLWLVVELGLFAVAAGTVAKLEGLKDPSYPKSPLGYGWYTSANIPAAHQLNTISTTTFVCGIGAAVIDVVIGNIAWPTESP